MAELTKRQRQIVDFIDRQGRSTGGVPSLREIADQFGFRSLHPGGANFLLGDGSVKFLKETIGMTSYWSLSTISGGELIPGDAL